MLLLVAIQQTLQTGLLFYYFPDFYTEYFEKLKTEMRSLHTWLIESGFPDEWPVNTSLNVNEEFLKKNDIVTIFVTFSHDTLTDFEVAAALTGITCTKTIS